MLPGNLLEKISFTQRPHDFPRVGRPARLPRARVSLVISGIRQAEPLALQKKGFTTALLPPSWCNLRQDNGDESGYSPVSRRGVSSEERERYLVIKKILTALHLTRSPLL